MTRRVGTARDLERVTADLLPMLRSGDGDLVVPLERLGVDPVAALAALDGLLSPVARDDEYRVEFVSWRGLGVLAGVRLQLEEISWPDGAAVGRDELERAIDVDCAIGGEHGTELDVLLPRSGIDPWGVAMAVAHLVAVAGGTSFDLACVVLLRGLRVGLIVRPTAAAGHREAE